jgi:hypothetical protein
MTSLAARAEPVLKTPLGKKLTPGALSILISHNNISALKLLAEQSPILEAFLPVFSKTLNKEVEMQTNAAIHRLVERAVTQTQINLEQEIRTVAEPLVQDVVVRWDAVPERTLTLLEATIKREDAGIIQADEDVRVRYRESRLRLEKQNDTLLAKVREQWQEKMRLYISERQNDVLGVKVREKWQKMLQVYSNELSGFEPDSFLDLSLNKPSPSALEAAFSEFTASIKTISDPVEHNKALESTLEVLNKSSTVEQTVTGLAKLGRESFPSSESAFSKVEHSMRKGPLILDSYHGGRWPGKPGWYKSPAVPRFRPLPRR